MRPATIRFSSSKTFYRRTIAPTGMAFCELCGLGRSRSGKLFFGTWNTFEIRQVTLTKSRRSIYSQTVVCHDDDGILTVRAAPDGRIYFSDRTSIWRLAAA